MPNTRFTWLIPSVFLILTTIVLAIGSRQTLPTPPLHELATRHGVDLGVYAAKDRIDEDSYRNILLTDFNFVVIDGQPNWQFEDGALRPAKDQYDFARIDEVLLFAEANHKPVRMHHFVWGEEKWIPDWLKHGNYSKDELLKIMEEHINTVGSYYRGRVREWTVVNEAFTRNLHKQGLSDWWADHIGKDYISKAFIWAKAADPDAALLLNDFGNEGFNDVSDSMYSAVKQMKESKIPIDGIGMQMHIDGTKPPKKEEVISNMQRFAQLGLKVYVTEFDVNMADVEGSVADKEKRQAQIYYDMVRACIESKACPSFAILGISDKESWYNELGVKGAMPLPFDKTYQPKPAYYKLREALN